MTVPMGTEIRCDTCARLVYKNGVALVVEAGIDPTGNSPIIAQLESMRHSSRAKIRDRYADILVRFAELANYGSLDIPGEMRPLVGELWEIKTSEDRVLFYDRKPSAHKRAIRVLHQFMKSSGKTSQGKTPRNVLDRGTWIMKGDMRHDTITPGEIKGN